MYNVVLVVLSVTVSGSNTFLLPRYRDSRRSYSPAANIARQYFSSDGALIWSNDVKNDHLEAFFHQYGGGLLQARTGGAKEKVYSMKRQPHGTTQYVIYISNAKDLEYFFELFSNEITFFNRGTFIIACVEEVNFALGCAPKRIFDVCWRYYVVNVMLMHQSESGNATLSTYFPMSERRCDNTEPKYLGTVSGMKESRVPADLFPKKVYNFNGCPLIVSLVEADRHIIVQRDDQNETLLSGIEGSIYPVLAEVLNASLKVLFPVDGYGDFNGTSWSGMVGDLFFKRANMSSFCFRLANYDESFRAAYPFRMLTMGWATPPIPLKPPWIKLIYPFDYVLRVLLTAFLISIGVTLVTLRNTRLLHFGNAYFSWYPIPDNIYMETCAVFIGQVAGGQPTKAALSFVFALWLWFSFIIRSSYQGALVGCLKNDYYRSDLDSLLGFINAGYDFGGSKLSRQYFEDDPKLYSMYKVMSTTDLEAQLDSMANGSLQFVCHTTLDQIAIYNLMANGARYLHTVPNDVIWRPLANYLPRDSPLVDVVDIVHGRIQSSGIELRFGAELHRIREAANNMRRRSFKQEDALTMHHMLACLLLVAAGWVLSSSLFLLELCWGYVISNRLSKR